MKTLSRSFFQKPTVKVAKNLLGKIIVRKWRGKEFHAIICETEAYVGSEDKACHASRGRTPRTEVMFWNGGHAYVYLIYGMHYCFNVVTEKEGFPSAVLIRGIFTPDGKCIKGPGRVCKYLHIDKKLNGKDLVVPKTELSFARDSGDGAFRFAKVPRVLTPISKALRAKSRIALPTGVVSIKDSSVSVRGLKVKSGPRIGIDYAGSWAKKPWRFWIDTIH